MTLKHDLHTLLAEPRGSFASGPPSPAAAEALARLPHALRRFGHGVSGVQGRAARCPDAADGLVEAVADKVLERILTGRGLGDEGQPQAYVRAAFQNAARDLSRKCRALSCGCAGLGGATDAEGQERAATNAETDGRAHLRGHETLEVEGQAAAHLRCIEALIEVLVAARRRAEDGLALREAWEGLRARTEGERSLSEQLEHEGLSDAALKAELWRRQRAESRFKDTLHGAILRWREAPETRPGACAEGELPVLIGRALLAHR
jgi:hypothetical protein